jgi:hypothetical protein
LCVKVSAERNSGLGRALRLLRNSSHLSWPILFKALLLLIYVTDCKLADWKQIPLREQYGMGKSLEK